MKTPKIHSYIRLVAGFFLLLATFFIVQSLVLHFSISRNFIPLYFRERHDVVRHIKEEILREAERDPHFVLKDYIARHNARYTRIKLEFVPRDHLQKKNGRTFILKTPGAPPRELLRAVSLNYKGADGYLILYSNRFQALSATLNGLSIFMVITLLPSLIIGFFIFRKIYRKSSILVEAVEKVSQGDYSVRVNLSGNDEYSQIGQAFNKMAASIAKSTRELTEMDLQRRRFIADISHELATPLTSLKGYVETMRMEELKLTNKEQQQYLGIVWDETERLSLLVKDLLELARMDAGTIRLEQDRIDCREFMKSFANRNALQLKQKGVSLEWQAGPRQLIYADYRRLEQIMQNLLDNALKHSTGLMKVSVNFSGNAQQTVITLYDDGNGIPSEHLTRIFERFYKVNGELIVSDLKQYGGDSGLGLSIVKGLVELHGGKIKVESNVGQGTTFIMEFPAQNHRGPVKGGNSDD
jgi:signal transduction histidine kinase